MRTAVLLTVRLFLYWTVTVPVPVSSPHHFLSSLLSTQKWQKAKNTTQKKLTCNSFFDVKQIPITFLWGWLVSISTGSDYLPLQWHNSKKRTIKEELGRVKQTVKTVGKLYSLTLCKGSAEALTESTEGQPHCWLPNTKGAQMKRRERSINLSAPSFLQLQHSQARNKENTPAFPRSNGTFNYYRK